MVISGRQFGDGRLVLLGAGGHARVCADVAGALGLTVLGTVDPAGEVGARLNGMIVMARTLADLAQRHPEARAVFPAIGNLAARTAEAEQALGMGYLVPRLVHPSAVVAPSVVIGAGSVVMPGAVINAGTRIGRYCIVNTSASIDHDGVVEDGAHVAPGCHLAGHVTVARGAFLGTGTSVIVGIKVGAGAVVGAGSAVIRDVPDGARVAGSPARPIRARAKAG